MLTAKKVSKAYPNNINEKTEMNAVSDVTVEIQDNAVTVIIGESGSGKSTLTRMLSYIEYPDSGSVFLDGTEITALRTPEHRKLRGRVQLVMQDAASSLDPHHTAEKILAEPLKLLLHLDAVQRKSRISELFQMVQLPECLLKHRVSELSGGQQKRLCIARALAAEPRYILFDESFSGLDVTLKKQVLTMLKELQKTLDIGMLIITHDLDTAMYMADRIYVMRLGRIIETINHPRSFSDFKESYSQELVKAALYKRSALQYTANGF